ncbi:MAG TPA: sugar phosphate isomerase/epimerase [Phycisphaerae bacterium]|nr:sugar phosphate isomerase/epimerase [Phycisphaerae bacterium]
MARPVTIFTGQWADLKFDVLCKKMKKFGYDGLELACWGDHFEVGKALEDRGYCKRKWETLSKNKLESYAISAHLVGQAVCDLIDPRHKSILPPHVWGDGKPEGVRQRATAEMMDTARAARKFFDAAPPAVRRKMKRAVVNGFTGSSIWHLLYSFPPVLPNQIEDGYKDFARRFKPILDVFEQEDVYFALEVHPTEIAFDIASAARAIEAVKGHKRFGFNYDPSHLGYQGVDYVRFIREFGDRVFHVHMKDVGWSAVPTRAGVFGGHVEFGNPDRFWDFRSLGHGRIDFDAIIRALNNAGYDGPLSVEWEDGGMDREFGAAEACEFVRRSDFAPSRVAFDAAFAED